MSGRKEADIEVAEVRTKRKMSTGWSNKVHTVYSEIIRLEARIVRV